MYALGFNRSLQRKYLRSHRFHRLEPWLALGGRLGEDFGFNWVRPHFCGRCGKASLHSAQMPSCRRLYGRVATFWGRTRFNGSIHPLRSTASGAISGILDRFRIVAAQRISAGALRAFDVQVRAGTHTRTARTPSGGPHEHRGTPTRAALQGRAPGRRPTATSRQGRRVGRRRRRFPGFRMDDACCERSGLRSTRRIAAHCFHW